MHLPSSRANIPRIIRPFYEFLFPPVCFRCEIPVQENSSLCDECSALFTPVDTEASLYGLIRTRLCEQGFCGEIVSPFLYEADRTIHDVIHSLKYAGRTRFGPALGQEIARSLADQDLIGGTAGIIPVPLHRTKERERGYNQAECIARGISAGTGLPLLLRALSRRRYTESQTTKSREERAENVGGAFGVDLRQAKLLRGRRFLLVDDVITTGATIDACAEVLVGAGALRPIACSAALAQP